MLWHAMLCCAVQGRYIHEATHHIPIIGDGDTGYGNAMNVKRTVRGYADAGFAGQAVESVPFGQGWGWVDREKRVVVWYAGVRGRLSCL
jgi:2-methylisocitrate lyase-like PEP mutase family enzyme